MPPLIFWTVGALGATVMTRWLIKETRRINSELDRVKAATADTPADRPVLTRDPKTGIYRPK
jgi:hypothetical protein